MYKDIISVIITTYKRPFKMLNRAIQSVINQTYHNLEIIIVDDSPADFEERKDIEKMILSIKDKRIKYIKHSKNMGACAARNTGIKESRGQYLAFLDDDDEWLPSKLEKQIKLFVDPDVGLIYCRSYTINESEGIKKIRKINCHKGFVFDRLLESNFIGSTSFPLIKRQCFEVCGMFDINLRASQDLHLWLRITKKYKVEYVNEPLVNYYDHDKERITTDPLSKIQGIMSINTEYQEYLNAHFYLKSKRLMLMIPYYLQLGQRTKAIQIYYKAIKLAPLNFKTNLKYLLYFFMNLKKLKIYIEKFKNTLTKFKKD